MRVNEYAILSEPNLHDGFADSLSVDRENKSARLDCTSLDGQKIKILFFGVRALCANEFRQGNIIGTIWIYKGNQIPREDIERLIFGESANIDVANKLVSEIQSSGTFFVKLWSSYGLQLSVICEEVDCGSSS